MNEVFNYCDYVANHEEADHPQASGELTDKALKDILHYATSGQRAKAIDRLNAVFYAGYVSGKEGI